MEMCDWIRLYRGTRSLISFPFNLRFFYLLFKSSRLNVFHEPVYFLMYLTPYPAPPSAFNFRGILIFRYFFEFEFRSTNSYRFTFHQPLPLLSFSVIFMQVPISAPIYITINGHLVSFNSYFFNFMPWYQFCLQMKCTPPPSPGPHQCLPKNPSDLGKRLLQRAFKKKSYWTPYKKRTQLNLHRSTEWIKDWILC